MLTRIDPDRDADVSFTFEGRTLSGRRDDTVASALLAAGEWIFRTTPVTGAPRGPFCMMGSCFDCLVEIDGVANCQACMTALECGMVVRRQIGSSEVML